MLVQSTISGVTNPPVPTSYFSMFEHLRALFGQVHLTCNTPLFLNIKPNTEV